MMETERIHVYPIGDTREHNIHGEHCECQPVVEGRLVIHNAHDAREFFEEEDALKRLIKRPPGFSIRTVTT